MQENPTAASRQRLADYLYEQAGWRDLNAEENRGDDRNRRSAEGLRALASHVHGLSDDDERLYVLAALDSNLDEPSDQAKKPSGLPAGFCSTFAMRAPTPGSIASSMRSLAVAAMRPTPRSKRSQMRV
ncbi:MAG: hypothetical protein ACRDYA_15190 [Egibacteraceae bacterium]